MAIEGSGPKKLKQVSKTTDKNGDTKITYDDGSVVIIYSKKNK